MRAAQPLTSGAPVATKATTNQSYALGIGLMVLGIIFILGALGTQSYCDNLRSGCFSLIYPNADSLYVVEGLGVLVFVVGLVSLIRRHGI